MAKEQYYFNEHDENQTQLLRKKRKKKKIKRKIKIVIVLFLLLLLTGYFVSDYSRVQAIMIEGQQEVSKEDIMDAISVHKGDILLFVNTGQVEDEILKLKRLRKWPTV